LCCFLAGILQDIFDGRGKLIVLYAGACSGHLLKYIYIGYFRVGQIFHFAWCRRCARHRYFNVAAPPALILRARLMRYTYTHTHNDDDDRLLETRSSFSLDTRLLPRSMPSTFPSPQPPSIRRRPSAQIG
jgi:hypothetical protein